MEEPKISSFENNILLNFEKIIEKIPDKYYYREILISWKIGVADYFLDTIQKKNDKILYLDKILYNQNDIIKNLSKDYISIDILIDIEKTLNKLSAIISDLLFPNSDNLLDNIKLYRRIDFSNNVNPFDHPDMLEFMCYPYYTDTNPRVTSLNRATTILGFKENYPWKKILDKYEKYSGEGRIDRKINYNPFLCNYLFADKPDGTYLYTTTQFSTGDIIVLYKIDGLINLLYMNEIFDENNDSVFSYKIIGNFDEENYDEKENGKDIIFGGENFDQYKYLSQVIKYDICTIELASTTKNFYIKDDIIYVESDDTFDHAILGKLLKFPLFSQNKNMISDLPTKEHNTDLLHIFHQLPKYGNPINNNNNNNNNYDNDNKFNDLVAPLKIDLFKLKTRYSNIIKEWIELSQNLIYTKNTQKFNTPLLDNIKMMLNCLDKKEINNFEMYLNIFYSYLYELSQFNNNIELPQIIIDLRSLDNITQTYKNLYNFLSLPHIFADNLKDIPLPNFLRTFNILSSQHVLKNNVNDFLEFNYNYLQSNGIISDKFLIHPLLFFESLKNKPNGTYLIASHPHNNKTKNFILYKNHNVILCKTYEWIESHSIVCTTHTPTNNLFFDEESYLKFLVGENITLHKAKKTQIIDTITTSKNTNSLDKMISMEKKHLLYPFFGNIKIDRHIEHLDYINDSKSFEKYKLLMLKTYTFENQDDYKYIFTTSLNRIEKAVSCFIENLGNIIVFEAFIILINELLTYLVDGGKLLDKFLSNLSFYSHIFLNNMKYQNNEPIFFTTNKFIKYDNEIPNHATIKDLLSPFKHVYGEIHSGLINAMADLFVDNNNNIPLQVKYTHSFNQYIHAKKKLYIIHNYYLHQSLYKKFLLKSKNGVFLLSKIYYDNCDALLSTNCFVYKENNFIKIAPYVFYNNDIHILMPETDNDHDTFKYISFEKKLVNHIKDIGKDESSTFNGITFIKRIYKSFDELITENTDKLIYPYYFDENSENNYENAEIVGIINQNSKKRNLINLEKNIYPNNNKKTKIDKNPKKKKITSNSNEQNNKKIKKNPTTETTNNNNDDKNLTAQLKKEKKIKNLYKFDINTVTTTEPNINVNFEFVKFSFDKNKGSYSINNNSIKNKILSYVTQSSILLNTIIKKEKKKLYSATNYLLKQMVISLEISNYYIEKEHINLNKNEVHKLNKTAKILYILWLTIYSALSEYSKNSGLSTHLNYVFQGLAIINYGYIDRRYNNLENTELLSLPYFDDVLDPTTLNKITGGTIKATKKFDKPEKPLKNLANYFVQFYESSKYFSNISYITFISLFSHNDSNIKNPDILIGNIMDFNSHITSGLIHPSQLLHPLMAVYLNMKNGNYFITKFDINLENTNCIIYMKDSNYYLIRFEYLKSTVQYHYFNDTKLDLLKQYKMMYYPGKYLEDITAVIVKSVEILIRKFSKILVTPLFSN